MSLFLGNLSSHVRQNELERVFWRFGHSSVQLKDGYGFVTFDVPSNAEKALRALRGKNICGEPMSITWANKQPRPFQRFGRGARFYDEPYRGKNLTRPESYGTRKKGFYKLPDYKMSAEHQDSNGGFPYTADPVDEEIGHHQEHSGDHGGEKCHNSNEGLLDGGASVAPNLVDNDRWVEPAGETLNDNGVENGTDFDRYEPYRGFDRRDQRENHQMNGSYGSPTYGRSLEKHWREHTGEATLKQLDNPKPQQNCYGCGLTGHIMRNCARADREKFTQFDDRRRDDRIGFTGSGEGESKGLRRSSWGRPNSSKDPMLARQQRSDRRERGSGKSRKLGWRNGSFPVNKETTWFQPKKDTQGKKSSRAEPGSPEKYRGKKSRKLASSPMRLNSIASSSRSHLCSSKFVSGISSCSRSRSVSSRSRSVSSTSTSSYSRSESSRFRSRSGSPSSLSLSISPDRSLPSSPSKVPIKATSASPNGYLENVPSPQSKQLLIEQKQQAESDANSKNSKQKSASVTLKDENMLPPLQVEDEMTKDSHGQLNVDRNHTKSRIGYEVTNLGSISMEQRTFPADNSSSKNSVDKRVPRKSQPLEHTESPSGKPNLEVPVNSQTNSSTRISSEEMHMVLKQHGLALPEESKKNLTTEVFFGSARLWPWEIIYYRRLKKGPISTENYARRVSQNKEFGIVDKYVRSSSGWQEFDHNNA